MKSYIVQLKIDVNESYSDTLGEWDWNTVLNHGNTDIEDYTQTVLLSVHEVPYTSKPLPKPPEFRPIPGRVKIGEATFDGVDYDAVAAKLCTGCAFQHNNSCEDIPCDESSKVYSTSVIFIKQQKD